MLDRSKLITALQGALGSWSVQEPSLVQWILDAWLSLSQDPLFMYKSREVQVPWLIPRWSGLADEKKMIAAQDSVYTVMAVDGSQIYPDKHQGSGCFLINIGQITLCYGGTINPPVRLISTPSVYAQGEGDLPFSGQEMINALRQEQEFAAGVSLARSLQNNPNKLLLFDGTLIFWHLETQDVLLRERFIGPYFAHLHELYLMKEPAAWYISLPKSRELMGLVRLWLQNTLTQKALLSDPQVERMTDGQLMAAHLAPGERTILFAHHSPVVSLYPEHLKPYFFYLHAGCEVGRVELPAWMALDNEIVDKTARIILDQCRKGNGYPIALAEAHEQAVVKGADRDFFYFLLEKMSFEKGISYVQSRKSVRKRIVGV